MTNLARQLIAEEPETQDEAVLILSRLEERLGELLESSLPSEEGPANPYWLSEHRAEYVCLRERIAELEGRDW